MHNDVKIYSLALILSIILSLFSCTDIHICKSMCPECLLCKNDECMEPICSQKCTCNKKEEPPVNDDERLESVVEYVAPPSGVELYDGVKVFVEDVEISLYNVMVNNSQAWTPNVTDRDRSGVGYFTLTGKAQIRVEKEGMTSCTVRPLSAGVEVVCNNGVATFTISSSGNYAIEPNGNPKEAFYLFVSSSEDEQEPIGNIIRFEKGLHTSENNSYINNNTVYLSSNTTVILEEGAVVRARFIANDAENIKIIGKGIIDGSAFERDAEKGLVTVPLDFNRCRNITFKDFTVLDPAGWCVNWYFCKDSSIDGVKIISSRSNGDGISIQSCQNIHVANCFLRTWDDTLVVKNYPLWSNRSIEGETRNITFENCTLWTDLAQSMEIGYETVGKILTDVTFRNITVLHNFHKPVMSIHNGNNADVQNILFDTITVEDAPVVSQSLCEFSVAFNSTWSSQHKVTGLGSISAVRVKNVTVLNCASSMALRVSGSVDMRTGYGTTHYVSDVVFENVWIKNQHIDEGNLRVNKYAEVEIVTGESAVICPFVFDMEESELLQYKDNAKVIIK